MALEPDLDRRHGLRQSRFVIEICPSADVGLAGVDAVQTGLYQIDASHRPARDRFRGLSCRQFIRLGHGVFLTLYT